MSRTLMLSLALFSAVAGPAMAAGALSEAEICDVMTKAVKTSDTGFDAIKGAPTRIVKGWAAKVKSGPGFFCMISRADEPPSPNFWCRTSLTFGEAQLSLKACFPDWSIENNAAPHSWAFAFSNPKYRAVILISADPDHAEQADINVFLAQ